MEHSFNIDIAKKYGINAAIVLRHIQFWIIKNKSHSKHFHDGRTWTYYSVSAFTKIFPYLTKKQVWGALQILLNQKVILKADYNKYKNTRTSWYAFVNENSFAPEGKPNKSSSSLEGKPDKSSSSPQGKPVSLEGRPFAPEGKPVSLEGKLLTDKDKQINKTDELTDKSRISQKGGLSSKDQRHHAITLLRRYGVDTEVARAIVYDQHTPVESIENVIKNGIAKEDSAKRTDGKFVLEAGYIVEALNQARCESKIVGLTELSRKLAARLAIKRGKYSSLSSAEIQRRIRRIKSQVAAMK